MKTNPSASSILKVLPIPISFQDCPEIYAAASALSREKLRKKQNIYDILLDVLVILLENKEKSMGAQEALVSVLLKRELDVLKETTGNL